MKSASHRKVSSARPHPPANAPSDAAPTLETPPVQIRLAARLRDLGRRLAQLDDALGADATDAPLFELDGIRSGIEESAAACAALRSPVPECAAIEDAVKRLVWAVQSLEACRELDDAFMARIEDVRTRLDDVGRLVGVPGWE